LNSLVSSWGWAICLLTITVKLLLFPLSISQIKSTIAMRRLKPEMDALNAKYKDDAQQRGLALQELWRKNKVANPMLGCLPVLLQMPVWWALYTSLQTAVELYHTPFGPFVPDLSAPGKYFIIPALLGASSFLQQHLMPMQGDPMQQRMMKWMMPTIFTVMMLFLPAGLGIYFLTNTWLGIVQQVAVERYYKSQESAGEPTPA
jgi:YidC/Oxa1 family membrane protein insertase